MSATLWTLSLASTYLAPLPTWHTFLRPPTLSTTETRDTLLSPERSDQPCLHEIHIQLLPQQCEHWQLEELQQSREMVWKQLLFIPRGFLPLVSVPSALPSALDRFYSSLSANTSSHSSHHQKQKAVLYSLCLSQKHDLLQELPLPQAG